ncbi:DMT family transporter [Priestia endophytica]|uniref:DMT family transporter n=1 Tax=Priestia endophytica TaxID=135735 RepID=UPI00227EA950|nr:DMT family transporter [Priestia endophytica]MCY8235055.1 DMT family transporter [Priestia endophytica]
MKNTYILGIFLALGAAILNGTVGILSKGLFSGNLTPAAVSFYKCFIAFIVLSIFALLNSNFRKNIIMLTKNVKSIALCSFLGIFVLYFFETTAYNYAVVPFVVFILLGSSVLTTFVFSSLLLKEKKNRLKFAGLSLLIIGLVIMAFAQGATGGLSIGAILAGIAGLGYGLFLVLTKKFSLDGGLPLVWYLMLFGIIYLFIPFYREGIVTPEMSSFPSLLALAIFPTIGGFYCTTMALKYLEANKVQFLELSEPIFATVFSFIILRETVQGIEWLGAFLILIAIYISEYSPKPKGKTEKVNQHFN